MVSIISNRNKRDAEFVSSSPPGFGYDNPHISKKLKSSSYCHYPTISVAPTKRLASRLSLYPQVTPIAREIQAPCRFVKGFTETSKSLDSMGSLISKSKSKSLFSIYNASKDAAIGSCRFVNFSKEDEGVEVVKVNDVDDVQIVNDENDASGDSSVEEIAVVKSEKKEINKPVESEYIIAKYMELDRKAEENLEFQPSTSSGVVSDLLDGKTLESLSLNQKPDVSDSDADLPYHKRLLKESAKKHDRRLSTLSFDIKLQEEKRASFKQFYPVKKEEDALIEPFRALTEEEEEMVDYALSNSSRRKVLVTHENSNITITGEVLQCLRPGAWLNDEVINVYMELLKEREKNEPKKFLKCHFFNTFFYKKLISGRTGYDYKSVRRWTTQRKLGYSLFECDKIFIPVHKEIHWCLAVINKKEEKFQYLDSLGGVDKQVMRVLAKYIVDEVKDKNGEDIDVTSWQQEYVTDLPNQENGFDCGVFMIKYADFYSRDIGLCFNQKDMPYFRKRTAKEILNLRAC